MIESSANGVVGEHDKTSVLMFKRAQNQLQTLLAGRECKPISMS